MTTLNDLTEAYIASRDWDSATLGRLAFWRQQIGPFPIEEITEDQVDQAITNLVKRGRLRPGGGKVIPTGNPLAASSVKPLHQATGPVVYLRPPPSHSPSILAPWCWLMILESR